MADGADTGNQPSARVFIAVAVSVAAVIPIILTGALSARLRLDLNFSNRDLGFAVAAFFVTGALWSIVAGRIVQRIGIDLGVRFAALLGLTSLLGMALVVRTSVGAMAFMAVGGFGIAMAQPTANMVILEYAPRHREGLVFGLKQGALPIAALVSGVSVPAVALTLGWRWTFAMAALLPAALLLIRPDDGGHVVERSNYVPMSRKKVRALVPVVIGTAFGSMAGNSVGTFFVPSLVDSGVGESTAGILLALGGASGVVGRVLAGWRSDRSRHGYLAMAAAMLTVGSFGFLLLASPFVPAVAAASILAFGFGWGWPGLVHLAVSTSHRDSAGAATALLQVGALFGAGLGPLILGLVVTSHSFAVAWVAVTCIALTAAALLFSSQRRVLSIE